jgi:flagellar motor switch protein FliM
MQDSLAGYRITIGENRLPTLLLVPRSLLLVLTLGLLGETVERAPDDRELTDLERSLIEYFLQTQWLPAFKETWPSDVDAIWQSPQTEVNPACSRLFKPDELVLVFTCVVMVPFGEQKLSWLFHKKGLAQLVGLRETTATPADPAHSNLEALVRGMPLDLVVVLGKVELGIAQLARLEVGDVLLLHQQVSEPLTAMVGDEPKFRGWAGRAGTSAAFRIESLIDE